jgi:predicted ATPase/DNA-binding SARP family transcriptional activator
MNDRLQHAAMDRPSVPCPPPLRAHVLGPLRLTVSNRPLSDRAWPRRTARDLLLLLLITPGHRLPREQILDRLWPQTAPQAAERALRVALHSLRRVLEPDLHEGRASAYIEAAGGVVAMRQEAGLWVDADAFEAALTRAERASDGERVSALREAVALCGGELLADKPYADWAVARREWLRRAWRRAVLELAEHELASAPLTPVPVLERLVAEDPTDEAAHCALMRAFFAGGRRDEALRQYARCIAALRDELEAEPSAETAALAAEIRAAPSRPSAPVIGAARIDNLPAPPYALVGRERDLEELEDILLDASVRLVTLTGPGGVGKTRLALEVARRVAPEFPDGACFVPLATVTDPEQVLPTVARALGLAETGTISPLEAIRSALHERELLLVLDNLEQVVAVAPELAMLLEGCGGLTVLTTSREPLHLRAEHLFETPPLPVPRPGQLAKAIARNDAVTLFAERARAVCREFAITDETIDTVAATCARLDGLPLAIELAAARSRSMAPVEILARLDDRLALLAEGYHDLPPRQRTMRAAIAWSYDLLDKAEQALFRRLAVFAGGWSLEAAEVVCLASGELGIDVADGVWALADKSLLRQDDEADDEPRYRMLETIREFGLERLAASGEAAVVRNAHAAYYLALAERAEPELTGPEQGVWFDRLEAEHGNLRAALGWSLERGESELALRLGAALWRFWMGRGYFTEGRQWLGRALEYKDAPLPLRAAVLTAAGSLAEHHNDYGPAQALHTQALAAWRAIGDRRQEAAALDSLGNVAHDQGDYDRALELHGQALAICQEVGDEWGAARALNNLGAVAYYQGAYDRAEASWREALAAMRTLGDASTECNTLNNLGALAAQRGDYAEAGTLHEQALALRRRLGDWHGVAFSLVNLGEVAQHEGDLARAALVFKQAAGILRELGVERPLAVALLGLGAVSREQGDLDRACATVRESLGLFATVGDRYGLAGALEVAAGVLVTLQVPTVAARLFAAAAALRDAIGAAREPGAEAAYGRDLATVRGALGDTAFAQAWNCGRALAPEQAVTAALQALADELPHPA